MKWVLVRSDRYMVTIEQPNVVHFIGRAGALPLAQQLGADTAAGSSPACKYVSRAQLAVVWIDDALYVVQMGKNPTFVGKDCVKVPSLSRAEGTTGAEALLSTIAHEKSQLLRFAADPAQQGAAAVTAHEVRVGLTAPHKVATPPARSYHVPFDANVLHFPEELGLPVLAVRAESAASPESDLDGSTAAHTSVPASVSLAVPSLARLEDEEEEGEEHDSRRGAVAQSETKAQWQGILDSALLNQQQQKQQEQQRQQEREQAPPSGEPVPPPVAPAEAAKKPRHVAAAVAPLPSTEVPFGAAPPKTEAPVAAPAKRSRSPTNAAPAPTDTRPSPPPPPHAPRQARIGFWEWMCHADAKADDPKSWRKYPLAVAQLLEDAYTAKEVSVRIPDGLLFGPNSRADGDDDAKKLKAAKCTYAVCFAEKTLKGGMIQYQLDDPTKFRVVRRKGGPDVDRRHVRAVRVIPSPSSSEVNSSDSDDDGDSSRSSSSSSSSFSSSSSSPSSEDRKRKRVKRRNK